MECTHLTELEVQLEQPDAALVKQAHLKHLNTLAWHLQQCMRAGSSREEFVVLQAADHAIQAAQQVLTNWPVPEISTTFYDNPRRT